MTTSETYPFPADCLYDAVHHMWVRRLSAADRQEPAVRVGIDALGLASLGELAYVTLSEEGTRIRRGEAFGTLEAAKMTGEIIAPLSGVLLERNGEALRDPSRVNRDPYGEGWLAVIAPEDWESESAQLIGGGDLAGWVEAEIARYRQEGWIE